ncbi:MAG: hypothetical protein EOP84_01525 [Verrucomicrobiaceae bacterium]|nr:MAG: hypothetical protein EOP84_01525 [Verrucomicrobiaceae bacterium]
MPTKSIRPLNIFIGCPGDMARERDALVGTRDHIESLVCPIKFKTWKTSSSGAGTAQRVIFDNDPVSSFDIVIILLWSRLGALCGINDPSTKEEMTGTEAEFVTAYDLHQSQGKRSPQVLLYRCSRNAQIDTRSNNLTEQLDQLAKLQNFFKQTEKGGRRPMLVQSFETAEDLKEFVTRDIKTSIERLKAPKNQHIRQSKRPSKQVTSTELIHTYFAGLRDQFSIYENIGLPVPERDSKEGEKDTPIPIRRLFVEPTFTDSHLSPEALDTALINKKEQASKLLPRLNVPKTRTVLLADPGMGKSTLIQWLISTLADESFPDDAENLRGAIPLPFILRDLVNYLPDEIANWNWESLLDAFRKWRHRGKGTPLAAPLTSSEPFFRSTLASANAFFLIDGLDEIGDPQRRQAIRNAIWEGFVKYPEGRWLITSRVVGYEQATVHQKNDRSPDRQRGFLTPGSSVKMADLLYLAPFDDEQQLLFARNWYKPRLGESAGSERAGHFMEAVRRHSHTRVISRVPNILYLLALLFRHRARLPDGRALVYAAISSAYLADIDLGRHLPDSLVAPWKYEEKEDLLALVAMRMQEIRVAENKKEDRSDTGARGEILVSRTQLEEWLGPQFDNSGNTDARADLHTFLDHISNRSGLLLPRGEGIFGFAHLSFQEYYAACYLEKEFRRILNQKAQTATKGIFEKHKSNGSDSQEKIFSEMSSLAAWHEPLLFLVEKLRNSTPDTHTFLLWTFPQLSDVTKIRKPTIPFAAAQLLAGISLDQEVALDGSQRETLWSFLWKNHISHQTKELHSSTRWNIAPSLLATSTYQKNCLKSAAKRNPLKLVIDGCSTLTDITALSKCRKIEELSMANCASLSDLSTLADLKLLKGLYLTNSTSIKDISPLTNLTGLVRLWLTNCREIDDISSLKALKLLKYLNISCKSLSDIEALSELKSLVKLVLSDFSEVKTINPITHLRELRWLSFESANKIQDLEPLAGLKHLNTLWLRNCNLLKDISPIANLADLTELKLGDCPEITEIATLRNLENLKNLDISKSPKIIDLSPLCNLKKLEDLHMTYSGVIDLSPLAGVKSLKSLYIWNSNKKKMKGIDLLKDSNPQLEIN